MHGKPDKNRKSKFILPQTTFNCDDHSQLCYDEFERTWKFIQSTVDVIMFSIHCRFVCNLKIFMYFQEIQTNNNDDHLVELCSFVTENVCLSNETDKNSSNMTLLRVAALITGINKPDHHQYFLLLSNTMNRKKVARTIFLPARDCPNVRTAIETLVSCILNNGRKHKYRDEDEDEGEMVRRLKPNFLSINIESVFFLNEQE